MVQACIKDQSLSGNFYIEIINSNGEFHNKRSNNGMLVKMFLNEVADLRSVKIMVYPILQRNSKMFNKIV